ncbi:hypothetical protein NDU88_001038 [Pleurodeles waltl]|uniref:Secreted protein n=1 Tax=Pleurodeles waltl TaxID=8319 RepID=A0AAV7VV92_PLEWA|nr:hypothetical protein NDU88_001038 [Pleurodeles waltl]
MWHGLLIALVSTPLDTALQLSFRSLARMILALVKCQARVRPISHCHPPCSDEWPDRLCGEARALIHTGLTFTNFYTPAEAHPGLRSPH